MPVDFPPNRLRQGYGEVVCGVLSMLLNAAIAATQLSFEQPQHPDPLPVEDGAHADTTGEDGLQDEADEAADADDLVDENLETDADDDEVAAETRYLICQLFFGK